jgi:hypothetical protein
VSGNEKSFSKNVIYTYTSDALEARCNNNNNKKKKKKKNSANNMEFKTKLKYGLNPAAAKASTKKQRKSTSKL